MKRDREPGGEHTSHNIDLDAVVGLRPMGTKGGGDDSTTVIVESTTFYEKTPGAGEGMVANVVRELENAGRRAGQNVDIVVRRQPRPNRIHGTPIWNATWEPQTPAPNWAPTENLSID